MAEITEPEKTCPRCGGQMEPGFLNAGKGPFRWVERPRQHKTIFGGEHLPVQHWILGAPRHSGCAVSALPYRRVRIRRVADPPPALSSHLRVHTCRSVLDRGAPERCADGLPWD
jgi:hypothetical protein